MQPDPEYLREYYGSLNDEALLAIDRSELVETAQRCYDEERRRRGQDVPRKVLRDAHAVPKESVRVEEKPEPAVAMVNSEEKPSWLDKAAEVVSYSVHPSGVEVPEAEEARHALEVAGIPCYLDVLKIPKEEPSRYAEPTHYLRLVVPGKFNMYAASVLERDIYNQEFEDQWRTHLEMLSDDELRAVSSEKAFCGLFDRIERVTRVYREEVERRQVTE